MHKLLGAFLAGAFACLVATSVQAQPRKCVPYFQGMEHVAKSAKNLGVRVSSIHLTEEQTKAFYKASVEIGLLTYDDKPWATRVAFVINDQSPDSLIAFYYGPDGCVGGGEILNPMVFEVIMDQAFGDDPPAFKPLKVGLRI